LLWGGYTVLFSVLLWFLLRTTIGIRVSQAEEISGLDISEHGMEAYGDFLGPDFFDPPK
jgi:Amt family ammonium transporter